MAGKRDQTAPQAGRGRADSRKPLWLDILDVTAKVLGALFLLAVAMIGNSFQARLTGISLQSQREQAESQLRANMFSNLISPIAGSVKDGAQLQTDREELLVELLALNFHENFELKPLLEDVDKKLAEESKSSKKGSDKSDPRKALRSIARRVADRQIGSIQWEWARSKPESPGESAEGETGDPECRVYTVTFYEKEEDKQGLEEGCVAESLLNTAIPMSSPDGTYTLRLVAHELDWKNQTIDLEASVFPSEIKEASLNYNFTLTWFDLPLTDNTLLPDGNRFAVNLQAVDLKARAGRASPSTPSPDTPKSMIIRVLWFPKGYFTPRERPLNFQQVRELIGLKKQ